MPLILGTNSIKDTGYDVANSLRFNSGSSDDLVYTPSSTGNRRTFTWSFWVKRSKLGANQMTLFKKEGSGSDTNGNGNPDYLGLAYFLSDDTLQVARNQEGDFVNVKTTRVFRDVSAWYHIIVSIDTTQGTGSNRVRCWVNGTEESLTFTVTPTQNRQFDFNQSGEAHHLGSYGGGSYLDGYLTECVFLDGTAVTGATDFGEFDEDSPTIWKPKDVSGLTFGTNGFYLDFENASSLGADVSGNSNNFTVNNLTSVDQSTDTCTNNFATLNPLDAYYESSTFSEGNLKIVTESSGYSYNTSTIGLTTGKWYCEVYIEATPHSGTKDSMIGVAGRMSEADLGYLGLYSDTYGIYGGNGNIYNGGSGSSYGVSHTTGDIIGIYLDLDNNKLYFAKNGTLMNSGTGKDITAASNTTAGAYFMVAADFYNGASGTYRLNFGSPIYSLSSANADANGQGSFEYNPSSGTFDGSSKDFYAINSKNLSEFG
jgi:hypothetical protein